MNTFGDYLKAERTKRGMSLRTFAEKCGISHTHIDSLEKGIDFRTGKTVNVTVDVLEKIAEFLKVDTSSLTTMIIEKKYIPVQSSPVFTDREKELIEMFRKCSEMDKNLIMGYVFSKTEKVNR